MKISGIDLDSPVTRNKVTMCVAINQLATPGLGSILAGRVLVGACQLLMAVAGFLMVLIWFGKLIVFYYQLASFDQSGSGEEFSGHWLGLYGGGLFFVAWIWALTSASP